MKNTLKIIVFILSIFLFNSCSKELEYGGSFDFKVNEIDNNSIVLFAQKTFELELTSFINPTNNRNFTFSYQGSNLSIIKNNIPLLPNISYNYEFSELKKLSFTLIGESAGDHTLTIILKDDLGNQIQKQVLVKVVEDLKFSFEANNIQPLYEDIITTVFDFTLNLENIGTGADSYKIKAFSSDGGTILINSNLATENELVSVQLGNISVKFTPTKLGSQSLTFVVVNSKNIEKEVTFLLKINQKVFTLNSGGTIDTKQTLSKSFSFVTANTIQDWQYKVKFLSEISAKIYTNTGVLIPLNTYVDLPLNTNSFTYKYLSNSAGDDKLTIIVQDKNGQTVSVENPFNILSKPTITQVIGLVFEENSWSVNGKYFIQGVQAYGGATITNYEFKILNYYTGNFDIYTSDSNLRLYGTTSGNSYYFANGAHTKVTNENRNINYYWNQPYTARVKDSDGVWSDEVKGTMTY